MFKEYYSVSDTNQKRFIIMQDDESGKFAILKSVKPEFVDILKTVDKTNGLLPQIYEYGNDYIIEEEIDGIKLADKLEIGTIPFEEIIKVILNVCDALTILHNAGVCHMDVNPQNIIEANDSFVLIDYSGLEKFGTKAGNVSYGTLGFCSPEHFGFDIIDASTDIYSVGALLKYLLNTNCTEKQINLFSELLERSMTVSIRDRISSIAEFEKLFENVCSRHTDLKEDNAKITVYPNNVVPKIVSTRDILASMGTVWDLSDFLRDNEENFIDINVPRFFEYLTKNKNLKKADIIKNSGVERTYAYQILNGTKKPSRDKLIQLCIGAKLSFEETQVALKSTGFMPLYPKIRRDCVIIYAIKSHQSIMDTEELLFRFDEDTFNNI